MECFSELNNQYCYQFQISLLSDLVWYTGIIDPVSLVDRISKEAAVLGARDKRWSHQVAQYIVEALNFRIFDWGYCYILFARRLIRIAGDGTKFSLARVIDSWARQVEENLSPQRSIILESAKLANQVSHLQPPLDDKLRCEAWDAVAHGFSPPRCLAETQVYNTDLFVDREPIMDSGPVGCGYRELPAMTEEYSIFELAERLSTIRYTEIWPIVKQSHCVSWVDELERVRARYTLEELYGTVEKLSPGEPHVRSMLRSDRQAVGLK